MGKIRINELARELEVKSNVVIEYLAESVFRTRNLTPVRSMTTLPTRFGRIFRARVRRPLQKWKSRQPHPCITRLPSNHRTRRRHWTSRNCTRSLRIRTRLHAQSRISRHRHEGLWWGRHPQPNRPLPRYRHRRRRPVQWLRRLRPNPCRPWNARRKNRHQFRRPF